MSEYLIHTNGSTNKETPLAGRRPNDTIRWGGKRNLRKYVIPSTKFILANRNLSRKNAMT